MTVPLSISYSSNCDEGGDNHTELDDGGALEPMLRRFRERNRIKLMRLKS